MSQPLNQAGVFRGLITDYSLRKFDSGAVAIAVVANILQAWNPDTQEWDDWQQYEVQATGSLFIVKKDNRGINQNQVQSLIKHCGWDGDLMSVTGRTWQPRECSFVVNEEKYEGETSYRISFVNDFAQVPGKTGNVTDDEAKELQNRYGSQFRALAGNATRNAVAPPASKPKMPKAPTVAQAKQQVNEAANAKPDDDCPF
jgi:hypothetical protein